jgi:replicative DNA helicase
MLLQSVEQEQQTLTSLSEFRLGRGEDLETFLASTTETIRGVQTGLPNLDQQIRGLQGIVGILGGPKACKSTLALQVALYNAANGNPVLFIDRENGLMHMRERIICSYYNIPWQDFCKKTEEQKIRAFAELNRLPFFLINQTFTMEHIDQWLDIMSATTKGNMVLVLDSLHKLPMELDNMRSSVDKWLLFLDQLKLKHNRKLTIITTCEKRRGAYGEAMKDAAKESGRIEYTLEQQLDMRNENGTIILECTYNRHGPTGDRMLFQPVYSRNGDKWSFLFKLRELEQVDI